jgi:hypothetical protein
MKNGAQHTLRQVRPPRPDIAAPPLPPGIDWLGEPVASIDHLLADRPALVHFFDFAQLNSVRTLPYLQAWRERYADAGLALIGVHSPRYPFSRDREAVAAALPALGIDWPVALDPEMAIWRDYEPRGWPSLFLWGKGGALRWHHLGEGEYAATEELIRETLIDAGVDGASDSWPPLLEPLRPEDAPSAQVVAPTPELFPGGSLEQPWTAGPEEPALALRYEAAAAYAATDGKGEIAVELDGEPADAVEVTSPGLQELVVDGRHRSRTLELRPTHDLRIHSLQFAPGTPA